MSVTSGVVTWKVMPGMQQVDPTPSHTPMRSRLLDERNSASVSADMTDPAHEEGQERHGDPEDEQLVIIDGWQDLLGILHQHTPLPDSIIHLEMYGLHITHHSIRLTDCEATIAAIREAVQESWRDCNATKKCCIYPSRASTGTTPCSCCCPPVDRRKRAFLEWTFHRTTCQSFDVSDGIATTR